jgi:hypothetical protein
MRLGVLLILLGLAFSCCGGTVDDPQPRRVVLAPDYHLDLGDGGASGD